MSKGNVRQYFNYIDVSYLLNEQNVDADQNEEPVVDNSHYKRIIVKSPCFTVKICDRPQSGKRLFACGTQLGQIFIGDVDEETTSDQEQLFYYQSRFYNTTLLLQKERQSPRILIPTCKGFRI